MTNDDLADRAQQLAADVRLAGLAVAHDALAGADHGDAHAVEDVRQVAHGAVDPAAGLALAVGSPGTELEFAL